MSWRKDIQGVNSLEGLTVIACILLIISLFQSSYWLMFIGSFLLILSRMSVYYLKHVSDHLELENEKETIRLSVGEDANLLLKISQLSRLPIFHATLQVKLEPIIEGTELPTKIDKDNIEFNIPIYLKGKESIQIPINVKAVTRGVTRIKSLKLIIPNFFGIGSVALTYNRFLLKEVVIYPTPIAVPHAERLIATKSNGYFPSPSSIFEQVLAPIGTRDYVYTDSFQRIHWKASAKTQVLQTKVFERTADYSWTFIINIRRPNTSNIHLGIVENYESIASNIAYLAQYASKHGINYEIFINLYMVGGVSVYHLPIGGGTHQLGKVLDVLARVSQTSYTQPINRLLRFVEKQQGKSPVAIICGPFGEEGKRHFTQMQKKGQRVYILEDDNQHPNIVPFGHC